jgi:8-hydroxy-5-deazaflavin:NADPH oxidoreductase
MSSLPIAIPGAGNVRGILGRKWAKAGHSIALGVKDPSSEKAQSLRQVLGEDILSSFPGPGAR